LGGGGEKYVEIKKKKPFLVHEMLLKRKRKKLNDFLKGEQTIIGFSLFFNTLENISLMFLSYNTLSS